MMLCRQSRKKLVYCSILTLYEVLLVFYSFKLKKYLDVLKRKVNEFKMQRERAYPHSPCQLFVPFSNFIRFSVHIKNSTEQTTLKDIDHCWICNVAISIWIVELKKESIILVEILLQWKTTLHLSSRGYSRNWLVYQCLEFVKQFYWYTGCHMHVFVIII